LMRFDTGSIMDANNGQGSWELLKAASRHISLV
jgi:hypothetical protein